MTEVPQIATAAWRLHRPARIKYRRSEKFVVRPEHEAADGLLVHLHHPWVMEADPMGHSLYANCVCWDLVERGEELPAYVCEGDFEWVPA